ncbi:MAG: ABC transporter permease [Firmicutes bacterium]|nr:ABC transporter permease [[Eubacterium] siraeum]MCM1487981.1 ABC transporter permease [Bacillota bacterium]
MKCKGWKQILSFNYIQYVKSKAFIASTAIAAVFFGLIMAAVNIIPALVAGGSFDDAEGGEGEQNSVSQIYILNETDYPTFDFAPLKDMGIECTELGSEEFAAKAEEIAASELPQAAVRLAPEINSAGHVIGIVTDVFRPEAKDIVSKYQGEDIGYLCGTLLKQSILQSVGMDKEDLYLADLRISTNVQIFGSEMSSEMREVVGALVPMFSALLMFVFIVAYAQIIAQSVAQEKTSRVIELLITSIRPLAIIVGKVLAMLLAVITQLAVISAVSGAAFALTVPFGIASAETVITEISSSAAGAAAADIAQSAEGAGFVQELTDALPGLFDPAAITAIIITFILGFLFYALLAGLVGAGVSRMEDLATAIQPLMFVAMIGFFLSYFSSAFNVDGEGNAVMLISRYIPISSPFALPAPILTGEMNAGEISVAILLLAVLTVLMAMLVAKVYENIIFYSGSPLKFGQILKMAKSKK